MGLFRTICHAALASAPACKNTVELGVASVSHLRAYRAGTMDGQQRSAYATRQRVHITPRTVNRYQTAHNCTSTCCTNASVCKARAEQSPGCRQAHTLVNSHGLGQLQVIIHFDSPHATTRQHCGAAGFINCKRPKTTGPGARRSRLAALCGRREAVLAFLRCSVRTTVQAQCVAPLRGCMHCASFLNNSAHAGAARLWRCMPPELRY